MTSPSNPTTAKPNATLASRTSALRTGLIAAFLATCAFFFFLSTSAAIQHDRANNTRASAPAWIFLLGAGFFLAPYIICWFLISRQEQKSIATGAGVACAFFGAFVVVSPYAFMAMFLFVGMSAWNGPPDRGLMAAGMTLLVYMVISLWIVWSAFKIGKIQWNAFGAAVGVTAVYLYFGFQSLGLTAYRGQRGAEQRRVQNEMELYKPAILARETIIGLTACLLRNHMLHPEAEYPATLSPPPAELDLPNKIYHRRGSRVHAQLRAAKGCGHRTGNRFSSDRYARPKGNSRTRTVTDRQPRNCVRRLSMGDGERYCKSHGDAERSIATRKWIF